MKFEVLHVLLGLGRSRREEEGWWSTFARRYGQDWVYHAFSGGESLPAAGERRAQQLCSVDFRAIGPLTFAVYNGRARAASRGRRCERTASLTLAAHARQSFNKTANDTRCS
jgi:hypothetical protein